MKIPYICPRCGFIYHLHPGGVVEGALPKEEIVAMKLSGKWRSLTCWKCERGIKSDNARRILNSIRIWKTTKNDYETKR